jgi:hypothetical protein
MSSINPLLFYMNAADYPEIQKDLKEIPCDKFITNYMPYPYPHNLARDFFLEHKEYTHLIVQPQDLHAKKEHYEKLIETVSETGYDVVSCVCNVEREGHRDFNKWAICKKIPSLDRNQRYYNWVPKGAVKGLVQVEFQGMVFACISRKIIESINLNAEFCFRGTIHVSSNQFAAAPDLTFCHEMKKKGIPIYANTDIELFHYANHKPNLVGKKEASTTFIKY